MKKERIDILVQQQEGISQSRARGLVLTGKVFDKEGHPLRKPGDRVRKDTEFVLKEGRPYVSRGGEKLEAALRDFHLDVADADAIDVGASTGGFTDCLLRHGAHRVCAVDVGYGQLAWELRQDERVVVLERTNIRDVMPGDLPWKPNFFTVDVAFISLRLVLPPLHELLADDAEGVCLIKPQFEAPKEHVAKGGVVRDPKIREEVIRSVVDFAESHGFKSEGTIESPLKGPAGNVEFLAHFVKDLS